MELGILLSLVKKGLMFQVSHKIEKRGQGFLKGLTLFLVKIDGKGPYQVKAITSLSLFKGGAAVPPPDLPFPNLSFPSIQFNAGLINSCDSQPPYLLITNKFAIQFCHEISYASFSFSLYLYRQCAF